MCWDDGIFVLLSSMSPYDRLIAYTTAILHRERRDMRTTIVLLPYPLEVPAGMMKTELTDKSKVKT